MAPSSTTRNALVAVSLFGLAWAHALGLTRLAPPTAIDWMLEGDWMAHLFGWLFTRNAPWGLPLALAPDLLPPWGYGAAMTDAIPLLSVVGKVLSPFFGERMQLFGLWMVLGVIGTGVAGVLACRPWLRDDWSLSMAGFLFVMNAVVSTRYGHPAFLGFWTLTGLTGAAVWPASDLRSARRTAVVALVLGFLACGIHAYLALMCAGVLGAATLRLVLRRHFSRGEAAAWLAAGPVTVLFGLWLFGFAAGARGGPLGAEGFGEFSADLLTYVNPLNWSRLVSGLPIGGRQYEGFAYLGLGVLALLALRLVLLVKYRPTRAELLALTPLLIWVLVTFVYALSNRVTLLGRPVIDLSGFYEKLAPLPSVFRSSGRFVWPLFALLTMTAAVTVSHLKTLGVRQLVLTFAVLVQLVDFNPRQSPLHRPVPPFAPFRDPAWQLMREGYRHVVVQPLQLQWVCPFDGPFIAKLSWEAYRQRLSINSGHVGRPPPGVDCQAHFDPARLSRDTIYIPYFPEHFRDFERPELVCAPLEGRRVCVFRDHDTPLLRELLRRATSG